MEIIIESSKAEPILKAMDLGDWDSLSPSEKRQVASRIYENDKSAYGKDVYTLLSTGNPNANNFVYRVTEAKQQFNYVPLVVVGLVIAGAAFMSDD